ncbi:hypothetical protein FRC09_009894 [Ceratobasidium sp. 395]|nr:hypothetical protein FRC09_009894 [Ceratobasidium sp. 395]
MRLSSIAAIASVFFLGTSASPSRNSSDVEARWPWSKSQISFAGCTKDQQSQLKAAVKQANNYISDSTKYLTKLSKSGRPTPRYTTWFGRFSEVKVEKVLENFKEIGDNPSRMTYDCSPTDTSRCTSTTCAYVNSLKSDRVNLCPLFWTRPTSGSQSQAGIIVHEFTHFLEYGGTKDHKYSHTECMALATSDPAKAITNANNYAFFAENTPRLS